MPAPPTIFTRKPLFIEFSTKKFAYYINKVYPCRLK